MPFRRTTLAAAAFAATAVAVLPAGPASAAEPYDGFGGQIACFTADGRTVKIDPESEEEPAGVTDSDPCVFIAVEGRVGTRYRPFDSTAGAGMVAADDPSKKILRVQIDKVVLGTQYGVLTTSGAKNSRTTSPPHVELQGPGHLWGRHCTTNYHVAVYWSARLSNGQLKTGKVLGPWYKSPTCS